MMLDRQASRRLAEMGIDTYVLRRAEPGQADSARNENPGRETTHVPDGSLPRIAFVVRSGQAGPLLVDVRRALRMAGVQAVDARAGAPIAAPAVVFGETGAVPEREIDGVAWIDSVVALRDAARKRRLWHELVTMVRVAGSVPAGSQSTD